MKYTILFSLILPFLLTPLRGQEGIYYYGANHRPLEGKEEAVFEKEVKKRSERKFIILTRQKQEGEWNQVTREKIRIQRDGSMVIYRNTEGFMPERIYREMTMMGEDLYGFKESKIQNVVRTGGSSSYLPLHLEGTVLEYYPYEILKSRSLYRDNQLIYNENWLPDGSRYIDSIFYSADLEPEYQMGDSFFTNYMLEKLRGSGIDFSQINDQVVIGWVIMETGKMEGVIALKGKSKQLNDFLVNAIVELPGNWTPARLNGAPVRYFMSIPLNFLQDNASFQEVIFSGGVMHYNSY